MDRILLQKLKDWRNNIAQKENIELFRVLPNKTIENIALTKPSTKEELLAIKGIKDKKFNKYGNDILSLVNGSQENVEPVLDVEIGNINNKDKKPYTVSNYLNLLNSKLREQKARIQGEISSLEIRENYLFFSLKDKDDKSVLKCFMWKSDYELCGVLFEEGLEIIVEGFSEVYKPTGRLSFRVSTAELVGEGALKKAYDQLKKKLEKEGLFAVERKKSIPEFSQKIGLITSETGAVIHDFLNNLGKYGYQIKFVSSRVEGQVAVRDLLSAINYFNNKDIDVLVIIRGGGSLESLQAFNNEVLIRRIASFNIPIICGIGHEKDIPLASLAADLMVSTPTAVTVALNKSWEAALNNFQIFEQEIINKYQRLLANSKHKLEILIHELISRSNFIFKRFEELKYQLNNKLMALVYILEDTRKTLNRFHGLLLSNFQKNVNWLNDYLNEAEGRLKIFNPINQLRLGYSIASIKGRVIKSIKQVRQEEEINIQVSDGEIKSKIKNIIIPRGESNKKM
ncbi:exodeoxyribonuclease VII large subunit [Patescibacteria group bacterium]|nr:exodeoxyribonuclease VII large subunit [Patescibacteria group bacterium]